MVQLQANKGTEIVLGRPSGPTHTPPGGSVHLRAKGSGMTYRKGVLTDWFVVSKWTAEGTQMCLLNVTELTGRPVLTGHRSVTRKCAR